MVGMGLAQCASPTLPWEAETSQAAPEHDVTCPGAFRLFTPGAGERPIWTVGGRWRRVVGVVPLQTWEARLREVMGEDSPKVSRRAQLPRAAEISSSPEGSLQLLLHPGVLLHVKSEEQGLGHLEAYPLTLSRWGGQEAVLFCPAW